MSMVGYAVILRNGVKLRRFILIENGIGISYHLTTVPENG